MAGERSVKIKFIADKVNKFVADTVKAGGAMERWEKQADRMGKASARLSVVTKAMIAPGAVPAVAALAVAGVGAAAALSAAGAGAAVFGGVLASSQKEVSEAATKVQDLSDKMLLYGKQAEILKSRGKDNESALKKQAAAALELEARLALLSPPVAQATREYLGMKRAWQSFVEDNQPATFGILSRGYALIRTNVRALQPLFDVAAAAAGRVLTALEEWADGGGVERLVAFFSQNAAPAFQSLQQIATNVFTFIGALFGKTVSQGQGLLGYLANLTAKLAAFGTGGGLDKLLANLNSNGPGAGAALVAIGNAAVVIAQALGPLAPVTIAIATALAEIIAAMPPEVITALTAAWILYTAAMTGYNAIIVVVSAVTKTWTAIQTAWAAVMALSLGPILAVVAAIALIIGIIVLVATKTTFFQDLWKTTWLAIRAVVAVVAAWFTTTILPSLKKALADIGNAAKAVGNFFVAAWNLAGSAIKGAYNLYVAYIKLIISLVKAIATAVGNMVNDVKTKINIFIAVFSALKSRVSSAASGLFDGIKNAFRSAVNYVIDGWNRLSFTLPSINTPFGKIGGTTLSTPNIGRLATGGWAQPGKTYLTGERGPELITTGRPAYVSNAGDTAGMLGGTPEIHVYIGDRELTDLVDVRIETNNRQLKRRVGARAGAYA